MHIIHQMLTDKNKQQKSQYIANMLILEEVSGWDRLCVTIVTCLVFFNTTEVVTMDAHFCH